MCAGFDARRAGELTETFRRIAGWNAIDSALNGWVKASIAYSALRPTQRYARAAMVEDEWYTDGDDEDRLRPGTFTVADLVLADDSSLQRAIDYLDRVDGEHQYLHNRLVHAVISARGLDAFSVRLLSAAAACVDEIPALRGVAVRAATPEAVTALLSERARLDADSTLETDERAHSWRNILVAIWGAGALSAPTKIAAKAPAELRDANAAILTG